jgi:hypothetical protein
MRRRRFQTTFRERNAMIIAARYGRIEIAADAEDYLSR